MAVSPPVLYNDWWVYMREMGSSYLNPTDEQIYNAYKMRTALQAQGYCEKALCGVIGAAQQESGITTGAIQKWSALPNQGESIEDVPNSYMLQYYTQPQGQRGWALGLVQWDGLGQYGNHKLVGWCDRRGLEWYNGDAQMARLGWEYDNDSTYHTWANNYGSALTWAVFKNIENSQFSNYDAGECAAVWDACYERSSGEGREYKRGNAQFWYQYFQEHPNPPFKFPTWLLFQYKGRKVLKNGRRLL